MLCRGRGACPLRRWRPPWHGFPTGGMFTLLDAAMKLWSVGLEGVWRRREGSVMSMDTAVVSLRVLLKAKIDVCAGVRRHGVHVGFARSLGVWHGNSGGGVWIVSFGMCQEPMVCSCRTTVAAAGQAGRRTGGLHEHEHRDWTRVIRTLVRVAQGRWKQQHLSTWQPCPYGPRGVLAASALRPSVVACGALRDGSYRSFRGSSCWARMLAIVSNGRTRSLAAVEAEDAQG